MSDLVNQNQEEITEMAMVDVAHLILSNGNEPLSFPVLLEKIREAKGLTEEEAQRFLVQLYTEINIDGRFVHVGEGLWGLKKWYPIEQFDEALTPGGRGRQADTDLDDYDQYEDYEDEDYEEELEDYTDDELDGLGLDDLDEGLDEDIDEALDEVDAYSEDEEPLPLDEEFEDEPLDLDLAEEEEGDIEDEEEDKN